MSNKMIKKAAACGLSAVMAFGLVAVTEAPKTTNVSAATKKVKKLSFKKKGYVMKSAGRWMNVRIRLNFSPKSSKTKNLTYKSSNKKIATVSSKGVVTAKKAGNATITATAKDAGKKKATFKVTVKAKAVKPSTTTTTTTVKPVVSGNKVTLSGIDASATQYVVKRNGKEAILSAADVKEALGYLGNPASAYKEWLATTSRTELFVTVEGTKGSATKTVTVTNVNDQYNGEYTVTVTEVKAGTEYNVKAVKTSTGATRNIKVTVASNGTVTAESNKYKVVSDKSATNVTITNKESNSTYTTKKSNGKYTIELPASIGKDVTITQTVTVTK